MFNNHTFFQVNHAVTVVGYDSKVFVIKNSWGSAWGEKGYINFDRKISNQCFIGQYPEYPNLVLTGEDEDNSEVCDSDIICFTFSDGVINI